MISNYPELIQAFKHYLKGRIDLSTLHDQVSLGLQAFTNQASEEELELITEVLSGIYEVRDGVLDESDFSESVRELVSREDRALITTGSPLTAQVHNPSICTSNTAVTTTEYYATVVAAD